MENQRDPKVSRAAAKDAAERLKMLALLVKDDSVLNKILCEADKTIRQHAPGLSLITVGLGWDESRDLHLVTSHKRSLTIYKQ